MNTYAASDKIQVFPAVNRVAYGQYASARMLSENNMAQIIRSITDTSSFVISNGQISNTGTIDFCIYGYIVSVTLQSLNPATSDTAIYAQLEYDTSKKQILGYDDGTNYTGIKFSNTKPTSDKYLKIAERSGTAWYVPYESKCRFNSSSLTEIDGGDLG